jgi:Holliday junction resolvase RusA-like endonuclease
MAARPAGSPFAPPRDENPAGPPLLIQIPLPYPELSPNFRPRFPAEKHTAIKAYRDFVEVRARNARILSGLRRPLETPVGARIVYVVQRNLRRDADNLLAQLKGAFDGMVRAGVLEDDSAAKLKIRELDVVVRHGLREGYVAIELEARYIPALDPSSLAARLNKSEEK